MKAWSLYTLILSVREKVNMLILRDSIFSIMSILQKKTLMKLRDELHFCLHGTRSSETTYTLMDDSRITASFRIHGRMMWSKEVGIRCAG